MTVLLQKVIHLCACSAFVDFHKYIFKYCKITSCRKRWMIQIWVWKNWSEMLSTREISLQPDFSICWVSTEMLLLGRFTVCAWITCLQQSYFSLKVSATYYFVCWFKFILFSLVVLNKAEFDVITRLICWDLCNIVEYFKTGHYHNKNY